MSTVTIEDTDTSALLYEPDNVWQTVQTNSGDSADTAHLSKVANANVTLSFTGTDVRVRGGLSEGTQVGYQFDDSAVTFGPPNPGHSTILQLTSQSCTEHTLKIITQPDQHIFVDNFVVTSCIPGSSSNSGSTTSSIAPGNSASSTAVVSSSPAAASSSATERPSPVSLAAKPSNAPVIAGVTVGVIVFLAVLAILAFLWMRRRGVRLGECCGWRKRPQAPSATYLASEKGRAAIQPFTASSGHTRTESTTRLTVDTSNLQVGYMGDVKVYQNGYDFSAGVSPSSFLNMKARNDRALGSTSRARTDPNLPAYTSRGGGIV